MYCSPEGVSRVAFKLLVSGSQWKLHMYIVIDKSIHGLMFKVLNQILLKTNVHSPDGHLHHLNLWFFQSNFIFGPEKPNPPRGPRALRCFPSIQLVQCCTWRLEITNNLIRVLFSRKDKGIRIFYIRVSSGYCMWRGVSFFCFGIHALAHRYVE